MPESRNLFFKWSGKHLWTTNVYVTTCFLCVAFLLCFFFGLKVLFFWFWENLNKNGNFCTLSISREIRVFTLVMRASKNWRPCQNAPLGVMLNFDAHVKNSDTAQPRVTNVKTPNTWLVPKYSFFLRVRCSTLTNNFSGHLFFSF